VNLPIGAIVRIEGDTGLAVVVPNTWARNYQEKWKLDPFLRLLGGNDHPYCQGPALTGGWWLPGLMYDCEIVPDDQVPDHIQALAMRCLLDPAFIPEMDE
jgi:hypothetical protein